MSTEANNIIEFNVISCMLFTSEPMDLFENIEVDVADPTHQFRLCRPAATNPALRYMNGKSPEVYKFIYFGIH